MMHLTSLTLARSVRFGKDDSTGLISAAKGWTSIEVTPLGIVAVKAGTTYWLPLAACVSGEVDEAAPVAAALPANGSTQSKRAS